MEFCLWSPTDSQTLHRGPGSGVSKWDHSDGLMRGTSSHRGLKATLLIGVRRGHVRIVERGRLGWVTGVPCGKWRHQSNSHTRASSPLYPRETMIMRVVLLWRLTTRAPSIPTPSHNIPIKRWDGPRGYPGIPTNPLTSCASTQPTTQCNYMHRCWT